MTIDAGLKPEGVPERSHSSLRRSAPRASMRDLGATRSNARWRWWARLLRGEPLDVVAREANYVSVAKLTEWRDRALAGAASALKERERDDRVMKSP